jgi:hypothetical protein
MPGGTKVIVSCLKEMKRGRFRCEDSINFGTNRANWLI